MEFDTGLELEAKMAVSDSGTVNAALGLLQLKHIDEALARRQAIDQSYREQLRDIKGIQCLNNTGQSRTNHAYFPIMVRPNYPQNRDELNLRLRDKGIFARRYFHPLISEFPMYRSLPSAHRDNLPVATSAARQVLCLPIYPTLQIPRR